MRSHDFVEENENLVFFPSYIFSVEFWSCLRMDIAYAEFFVNVILQERDMQAFSLIIFVLMM